MSRARVARTRALRVQATCGAVEAPGSRLRLSAPARPAYGISVYQAAPARLVDRLGLGMHFQLAVDPLEMAVHGAGADAADLRRLGVGKSLGDHLQDLVLAPRQARVAGYVRRVRDGPRVEPVEELARDHGGERRTAVLQGVDVALELLECGALQEIAVGACFERGGHRPLVAERGDDQRAATGAQALELADDLDPRDIRQADVHQHDVEREVWHGGDRRPTLGEFR